MSRLGALALALAGLLAGCGHPVAVTSNVSPSGVRTGDNVVAFEGDEITADWPALPATDINLGLAGATTVTLQAGFTANVIDAQPTPGIVVIQGGINDLMQLGAAANVAAIKKMVDEAHDEDMRVILCAVLPRAGVSPAVIEAFNQQILTLAQAEGVQYADFYSVFIDQPALMPDGDIPDADGYAAMWAVLSPLIQEVQS